MSYSNNNYNNFVNTDLVNLQNTATNYEAAVTAHQKEEKAYQTSLLNPALDVGPGSSWKEVGKAYNMLLILLATGGSDTLAGQLGVSGEVLHVQGDIAACNNDLQNITHSSQTGANGATDVQDEMNGLDTMNSVLTGSGASWYADVQQALGGTAGGGGSTAESIDQQYVSIRQEFVSAPGGNPNGYYFDPSDTTGTYLTSFGQMQTNMGQPGDIDHANEASDGMVGPFNIVTSTASSANTATNEKITQEANDIKSVTSFLTDMAHSQQDVIKGIVNNSISR